MRVPLRSFILSLPWFLAAAQAAESARPNILWLVSEDNIPILGCYGEPLARTPHLDRLQLPPSPAPAELVSALSDPLPVVRYCGTIGAMRAPLPPAVADELHRRLADAEPMVRLGAAHALLRRNDSAASWPVIAGCLAPSNSGELRLATLNVITLLGNWPESLRPVIAAPGTGLGRGGENYVASAVEYLLRPAGESSSR